MRINFIIFLTIVSISCTNNTEQTPPINKETLFEKDSSLELELAKEKDDRQSWQKPDEFISKLGNLSTKTIADLGAGIGYFSFKLLPKAQKVIAIDVDKDKIDILNGFKNSYKSSLKDKLDIRLATSDNPMLEKSEVDIILIVNTIAYIDSRIDYFTNIKEALKAEGQIIIVDFKTKRIPDFVNAPPFTEREYLHVLEEELIEAGYIITETDDTSLEYQFIIFAQLPNI